MPKAWTEKDEKQYQEIKKSLRARGKNEAKAAEIAGRTVNKQRRKEGRTLNKTSLGTGNPNVPLENRTKTELYNRSRQLNISGRSSMTKDDLINAIRRRQ